MTEKQRTVATAVSLEGVGLHSGEPARVTIKPGAADDGFVFVRTDLDGPRRISACGLNSGLTMAARERRTTLTGEGGASVQTVEHLLSALYGLGLDTAVVEIDGPEPPGLDGSARPYVEALQQAGTVELAAPRRQIRIDGPIALRGGRASISAMPGEPGSGLSLSYTLDYSPAAIPHQHLDLKLDGETYAREIAGARTFVLENEAKMLRAAGMGKGATPANTLVVAQDGSVVDNELRFADEFVRHKMLDLIGDLALLGGRCDIHVVAIRSGHDLNGRLVQRLLEMQENGGGAGEMPSAWDIEQVMKVLPHRYPFLMIDRVVEYDPGKRAVGLKNVSINEPFFQGHFPTRPVMPGVLIMEAMAQLGGAMLLTETQNAGRLAYLIALDDAKFRKAVTPGDQLRIEVKTRSVQKTRGHVDAVATVDGKTVASATLKFMLVAQ